MKSISGLLRGITSNHNGDFYCLNCLHLYTTEKKLKKHETICKDHDFCDITMTDEDNKILKYISGEKSLRVPFTIYADLECLLRKINTCSNNLDKSYTEKKATHRPSGYSLVICCSFEKSKNECNYYRGKDCVKIFCKDLKDQAKKIINYEKKEMMKKKNHMKIRKFVIYVKKNLVLIIKIEKIIKSEIIVIIQENIEELLIIIVICVIKYPERFL